MNKIILFFILNLIITGAFADRRGNGGDEVRLSFIKNGQRLIQLLKKKVNQSYVNAFNLDIDRLEEILNIHFIKVTSEPLVDNGGSDVDALGSSNGLILNKASWGNILKNKETATLLVFHEMLRGSDYNDDNFIISASLNELGFNTRELYFKIIEQDPSKSYYATRKEALLMLIKDNILTTNEKRRISKGFKRYISYVISKSGGIGDLGRTTHELFVLSKIPTDDLRSLYFQAIEIDAQKGYFATRAEALNELIKDNILTTNEKRRISNAFIRYISYVISKSGGIGDLGKTTHESFMLSEIPTDGLRSLYFQAIEIDVQKGYFATRAEALNELIKYGPLSIDEKKRVKESFTHYIEFVIEQRGSANQLIAATKKLFLKANIKY